MEKFQEFASSVVQIDTVCEHGSISTTLFFGKIKDFFGLKKAAR